MSQIPTELDWRKYALFLDFDGTLTPIVSTPDAVVLDPIVRTALENLRSRTDEALAVVSGRSIKDLECHLSGFDCVMSGSHGLEFRRLDGQYRTIVDASGRLSHALAQVSAFASRHDLIVEDKPGAVTLHYREQPGLAEDCHDFVEQVAAGDPSLRTMHGKMVSEVLLTGIDKGTAISQLMTQPVFKGRMPIMAGDDVTDEAAFVAVQNMGGFGIKIGPGSTAAIHRAEDIDAFLVWLCKAAAMPD